MTLVVKIGGAAGIGGEALLDDLARHGDDLVVVHGGSDETTRLQERLGRPAEFLTSPSGHVSRRTDRETLEAFAMATALVNRRLVEGLLARRRTALGLSGLDGRLLEGPRKGAVRTVENGRVRVLRDEWTGRPERADGDLLGCLLGRGLVPVVAPLAASPKGEMLNVDGDRAAACLATGLGAATLLILTNVPGLLRDPEDATSLITHVPLVDLEEAAGFAQGRMKKKVLGAREALEGGVERVILADARREAPLTDALHGLGTVIGAPLAGEVHA